MNSPRNHNPSSTHELLSAYFDRETTPGEVAEIERLLERSPEARQMLDDFAELSDLLHELPRHTPDAGFANRVLEQARSQPIAASVLPLTVSRRASRWKWSVGFGLATTAAAACIVVVLMLAGRQAGHREVAMRDAAATASDNRLMPLPGTAQQESIEDVERSRADDAVRTAVRSLESTSGPIPSGNTRMGRGLGGAAAAPAPDAETLPLVRSESTARSPSGVQLPADIDLNEMAIGSVVEALQTRGDEVSMVKLTVVDVVKGVDRIKVMLTKNSIVIEDLKGTAMAKFEGTEKPLPGQLPAIYVEAPRRQFEAALAQLKEEWNAPEPIVLGVRLEPAVDALAMNEIAPEMAPDSKLGQQQRRLAFSKEQPENRRSRAADKAETPAPKEIAKDGDVRKSGTKLAAAGHIANAAPADAAGGSAGKSPVAKDAPASEAKQYVLNVPQGLIERSRQRGVANQIEARAKAPSRAVSADESKHLAESASAPAATQGEETLQVLFLFEAGSGAALEKARGRKVNTTPRPKKS